MIRKTLVAASILICKYGLAQISPDTIQKSLIQYHEKLPQEKIYMHLDRPHYAPGDTIWFKLYIADASTHTIDSTSKNIYVDLFQKNTGKKIRQLLLRNLGGYTYGRIALRDTLSEGVYEIRAFTNWMRNFSERQFFQREVYVRKNFAVRNAQDPAKLSLLEVADLQFFPEGGNLVTGLQNRVAFKGVNKYGQGIDFAAFVISDHKDTVATIHSEHLGMGSFVFTPKVGFKYFARIAKVKQGQQQALKQYNLPDAVANGYALFVDNLSSKQVIKVTARNNFSVKDRPILIGQCRGVTVFNMQSAAEGNSFSWTLEKTDIPDDGVVQLTIFDSKGAPQAERLVYNDTEARLNVTVSTNKAEYLPHEKVTVTVLAKDYEGNPVQGNFSLAATDNQLVDFGKDPEDIRSYFYLSSDVQALSDAGVKGTVEQPGYYFNSENTNAPVHLDILLMTQGWRRFLWKDVLAKKQMNETFEIETGLSIHGHAKLTNGKKLTKPLNISILYAPEPGTKTFGGAKTDLDGNFSFKNISVKEPVVAMIQGSKENGDRSTTIIVDEYKWPTCQVTKGLVDPFFFDAGQVKLNLEQQKRYAEQEEYLKNSKAKVLKEVTVTARKQVVIDPRKRLYDQTNFQNIPVSPQACATATHVLQLLQGRAAGLTITVGSSPDQPTGLGDYSAVVRGQTSFTGSNAPKYLLDGMIIEESYLRSIPPCMIESIDVITHPVAIYDAKGLVSILTKYSDPNYSFKEEPRGTAFAKINGYEVSKEFYSPKYQTLDNIPDKAPDFRPTLYWNPVVKTNADGKAQVTFWNSDEKTSVRIAVEGISVEGTPATGKFEYIVK